MFHSKHIEGHDDGEQEIYDRPYYQFFFHDVHRIAEIRFSQERLHQVIIPSDVDAFLFIGREAVHAYDLKGC